jgi:DNA-binding transcriptional MerR regulator
MLSQYFIVAEAANISDVTQGTIRFWSSGGKIPMHQNPANGNRLFRKADLDDFFGKAREA